MAAHATGDPLTALRDIHLPAEPGLWPPAPGWWVLAAAALVAVALAVRWAWRRHRRGAAARAARRALDGVERRWRAGQSAALTCAEVSTLLKRLALARHPRREVARLAGRPWLEFLAASGALPGFVDGPGEALARAPYRPGEPVDVQALVALARRWIETQVR